MPSSEPVGGSVRRAAPAIFSGELMTRKMRTLPKNVPSPSIETATAQADLKKRPRRLRRTESIRALVRETVVRPEDLIYPLFVVPDNRPHVEIQSMPGVWHNRVREAVDESLRAWDAGIRAVLLFGLPETKDATGSASWDPSGPVQSA